MAGFLNSFTFDYVARQKLSGLNMLFYIVKQLPALEPRVLDSPHLWCSNKSAREWVERRVLNLTYTAWDMQGFAESLDYVGKPLPWSPNIRDSIRAELDAAFFHLYGIARDDVDYIMDTFPIVKRKDEAAYGEYRTKRLILEIFDAMAEAERSGVAYQSPFDDLMSAGQEEVA
jgi:hypothetical protein